MSEKSGETSGGEEDFGAVYQLGSAVGLNKAANNRRLYFGDVEMKCYDWTSYMREIFIDLRELDEYRFTVLFHWVVDTPVAAAQDHPEWQDDVRIVFSLYTDSGAFITSFVHYFRRGCLRYLHEVRDAVYTSQVAHPIVNLGGQLGAATLGGQFRLRVTAC